MAKPKQLWYVECKLSDGPKSGRGRYSAKGGKLSSLRAAKERRELILRYDPAATVTISGTGLLTWTEITG